MKRFAPLAIKLRVSEPYFALRTFSSDRKPQPSPSEAIVHALRSSRAMEEAVGLHIGHPECADIPPGYKRLPDGRIVPAVEFGTEYAANVAAAATSTQRQAGTVSMVRDTTIEQESTTTQTLQQDGPGREQQTIVEQATTNIHEEYTATYNDLAVSGVEFTTEGPQSTIKPEASEQQRGI